MKGNFQTILIGVFLAFAVFAVLIFSGLLPLGKSSGTTTPQGNVVVWGTFPSSDVSKVFDNLEGVDSGLHLTYIEKSASDYQQSLIEAFANGNGPDIFIISPDMIIKNQSYIYPIPFTSYPQKTFTDTFIDGADVYVSNDGIIGFPIAVDPMVLYYNKDILANSAIPKVPETWDELFDLNKNLTIKKTNGAISQSMIALGRFDNITNAKDIFTMLLMQGGNSIITRNTDSNNVSKLVPIFSSNFGLETSPAESVLTFFTEFSNQSFNAYSWNKTLPESKDFFTSGKLAFYIGKASELFNIESVNPNLSFDVSQMLQTKGTTSKKTFGDIYALAVNKKSTNLTAAFAVAGILSSGNNAKNMSLALSLPPVQRTLLADKPTDAYMYSFYDSAVISHSWLDPDSASTDSIFNEMINNVLSNKLSLSDSINRVQNQLLLLVQPQQ